MSKKRMGSRLISFFIALVLILGNISFFAYADNSQGLSSSRIDLREEALSKIDNEVFEAFKGKDQVEALVYLKDQLDVNRIAKFEKSSLSSALGSHKIKLEVRKTVAEALKDNSELSQRDILNYLADEKERGNVSTFESYHIVNMVYVKATKEVIEELSYMKEIERISKNKTYTMESPILEEETGLASLGEIEWNVERVKADQVWGLGFDGTGVVVGILDSGVDWTHPALKNKWRGYNPETNESNSVGNWFDPVYNSELPEDTDGHGTHVAGTILGQEENGSNKIGVAPGAKWIGARVFNKAGSTTDAILLSAAEWILAPNGDTNSAPDVVNNSWGGLDGIDDWYREAVRAWRAAEILPVFAAGNQRAGEPAPWPGSIAVPSNYPESFAVAATDKNDLRGYFSKLGPSPYDASLIKPDISAPGVGIRSSIPGGKYAVNSGTSMAAPAISGSVALLLSADASLTVDEIEETIKNKARGLSDSTYPESPNMAYGYGIVDTFEAVSSVATGTGFIEGQVLGQGSDQEAPVIVHDQESKIIFEGNDLDVLVEVSDDVAITQVELLIKQDGKANWRTREMELVAGNSRKGSYKATIDSDLIIGEGISYKIKAVDYGHREVATETYRVDKVFGILPDQYEQGFEKNPLGWIFDGSWEYGLPTGASPKAYEGRHLAGTIIDGPSVDYADDWMITPPIDLRDSSLKTASLRFHEWYDIQKNFDKGYVLISTDQGENWQEAAPIRTGSAKEWKEAIVLLDDYIGFEEPIFIAFRHVTDGYKAGLGWYIDNVRLVAEDTSPPSPPSEIETGLVLKGIKLNWTASPDLDVKEYNVYRSTVSGRGHGFVGKTKGTEFVDTNPVSGKINYYIVDAIDTSGNYSEFSEEIGQKALRSEIVYREDFERNNGGFTKGGSNNPWEWGAPNSGPMKAISGEKLWATKLNDNYPSNSNGYIESPSISIPEVEDLYLVFSQWVDMEGTTSKFDYGQVLVSKDDGDTWDNITPESDKKYGTRVREWTDEALSLANYKGETIKIRFSFISDSGTNYAGWYIDDISILGFEEPIPTEERSIIYDDGTAEEAMVVNKKGDGLAVKFTPSGQSKVIGAEIYFWGEDWPNPGGNRIGFNIFNEGEWGRLFPAGPAIYQDIVRGSWNRIDLSGFNFTTDKDFYISTIQDDIGDNNPGLGIDSNSPHTDRSYIYANDWMSPIRYEGIKGGFMIRAIVESSIANSSLNGFVSENREDSEEVINKTEKDIMILGEDTREYTLTSIGETPEPKFSLGRNGTGGSIDSYGILEDELVDQIATSGGGIPTEDSLVTILETGVTVRPDPITGKFFMRHKVGSNYTLRAEAYGYQSKDMVISVKDEQTTRVDIMLDQKPKGRIEGRVFDRYYKDGAGSAVIRLVEDGKIKPVIADDEGYFAIEGVYEGDYSLKIKAEGFEPGQEEIRVIGGETSRIDIGLKSFVGYEEEIVYDDGNGENALVINGIGYGLATRFTPEYYGKLKGVNIYFWDINWPIPGGDEIGLLVYETDGKGGINQVGQPIVKNVVRGEFNYIDLSEFNFATDRDFYISTIQTRLGNDSPGVGIDTSSKAADRSYINIDGEFTLLKEDGTKGGLMMRARMEYSSPLPQITNLDDLTYTNKDTATIEGKVAKDGQVNIYVNDRKIETLAKDLKYKADIELREEENIIKVSSQLGGKETEPSREVRIIKDQEAPNLRVDKPLDNSKINTEVINIEGSVTDNTVLDRLMINNEQVQVDEEGNYLKKIILDKGENLIEIRALDKAGNETLIERNVVLDLDTPIISNISLEEDMDLMAGELLRVSFAAPAGGRAYFKLNLPLGLEREELGIEMTEKDGVYSGSWTVPEGYLVSGLGVSLVYISESGNRVSLLADGRINIVGDIKDINQNTIIIGQEAFDARYIDSNEEAKEKLKNWSGAIYIKLNEDTLVDEEGRIIDIRLLPDRIKYMDKKGDTIYYVR